MEKLITLFNASEIDKTLVLNKLMDVLSFMATGYEITYNHETQARFTIKDKRITVVASRTNEEIGADAFEQLEEYVRECDVLVTASKTADGTLKAIESFAIKSKAELIRVSGASRNSANSSPVAELLWTVITKIFFYLAGQE